MKITRLRLLGFKSFVEPTEFLIEPGLTGVVGPNGCGKSNLLEALRWVMGETSYKSMRGAAMDDVIFAGSADRPARNIAEVTLFIDNSARTAPAEFNDTDALEVTRRIEREAGSTYRVNGKDARARDVQLLFADAATGARSPALVRQGRIGEIITAKPAGAPPHAGRCRRHCRPAHPPPRGRASPEGGRGQSRAPRRSDRPDRRAIAGAEAPGAPGAALPRVSGKIREAEALQHHLHWPARARMSSRRKRRSRQALGRSRKHTKAEGEALRQQAEAAEKLQPLRDEEAARGGRAASLERRARCAGARGGSRQGAAGRAGDAAGASFAATSPAKRSISPRPKACCAGSAKKAGVCRGEFARSRGTAAARGAAARAEARSLTPPSRRLRQATTALAEAPRRSEAGATARRPRSSCAAHGSRRNSATSNRACQARGRERQRDEARRPEYRARRGFPPTVQAHRDRAARRRRPIRRRRRRRRARARPSRRGGKAREPGARDRARHADEALGARALIGRRSSRRSRSRPATSKRSAPRSATISMPRATRRRRAHWRLTSTAGDDPALPDGAVPLGNFVKAPAVLSRRLQQIGVVDARAMARASDAAQARAEAGFPGGRPLALGRLRLQAAHGECRGARGWSSGAGSPTLEAESAKAQGRAAETEAELAAAIAKADAAARKTKALRQEAQGGAAELDRTRDQIAAAEHEAQAAGRNSALWPRR